jgi:hypothetical protein
VERSTAGRQARHSRALSRRTVPNLPLPILAVALAALLGALLPSAAAAPSALPQQSGVVDLLAGANVRIDGALPGDHVTAAGVGDVNGDGLADVLALRVTRSAERRLSRLLAQGRRPRAVVTVVATDRSGNERAVTRSIALRS